MLIFANLRNIKQTLLLLTLSLFFLKNQAYSDNLETTATAKLISEFNGIESDGKVSLAVVLTPKPGWHVYWKYAGDFGSAPKFNFKYNGKKIKPKIEWPTPDIIRGKSFVNYGYSKKVLYLTEFIVSDIKDNNKIELDFEWLVCKVECIPGFEKLVLNLSKVNNKNKSKSHKIIEDTRFKLPIPLSNYKIDYQINDNKQLELFFPELPNNTKKLNFIPETKKIIKNSGIQEFNPETKTLTIETRGALGSNFYLKGLLIKSPEFETGRSALNIELGSKPKKELATKKANNKKNFALLLLASLIGGIILNFMPCVFPVIGLKVLSLSKKTDKNLNYKFKHSVSFAFGILATFWTFALIIKIAKKFGNEIGWGFQLQNSEFVIFLIFLLLLVALNLIGLFELRVVVNQCEQNKDKKDNLINSFLSGILTTVLATPCTAPFMASALAYGLSASYIESFLIFTFLALGLSLPYTLLACIPGAVNILPKPGAWMNKLKIFLAFPIFGTIIWLLWVLEMQTTSNFLFFILFIVLGISLATWIFGIFNGPCKSKKIRTFSLILFLALIIGSYYYSITNIELKVKKIESSDQLGAFSTDKYGQKWYSFKVGLLDELESNNKSYYLDVTAAWCLTCQLNKTNVFGNINVRNLLFDRKITLVKADWTNHDASITKFLESNQKAGVPLNIYFDGKTRQTLPKLLSANMVLKLIKKG